jgi:hypothetical protein
MAKEAEQGQATPAVVPGYGEADDEAASMDKAAGDKAAGDRAAGGTHDQADAGQSAPEAAAKIVPDVAGPIGYGTTETDVKKRIAEIASRETLKPADAG